MQQHSQIVELKDRLQKSIDDSYNVKDINEVTRVISVLERMHVTREDLEKTRVGKIINELRRNTTDKELAKRLKKLIKSWQSLMVSNGHRNGPTAPAVAGYSQKHSPEEQNSPVEAHDEDSNSSVFSNLSVDGIARANSRSLLGSPSAPALLANNSATKNQQQPHNNHNHNSSRKRKLESETDTLRENLASIMISGGRRTQTTQELAQKYNIQIKPSLSASSSPHLQINNKNDSLSPAKRPKINGTSYHAKTNGFHHHDENSLHELNSALPVAKNNRYHNKSLPASPALQSLRNNTSHSANTSPALLSSQSHLFENDVVTRPNLKVKIGKLSRQTSPAIATESISAGHLVNGNGVKLEAVKSESTTTTETIKPAKRRGTTERTVSEVDRDIREIYAQLPPIKPEDFEWKETFQFDTDEPEEEKPLLEGSELNGGQSSPTLKVKDENVEDNDEYELFEYNEEYEEMEDEEVEITDEEAEDEDEENVKEIEPCQRVNEQQLDTEEVAESAAGRSGSAPQLPDHNMGDILQCDKPPTASVVAGGSDFKSESGVGGLETNMAQEQAEPDSIYNSCDDSTDAISSSTSEALKQQEADSTTIDEQQQQLLHSQVDLPNLVENNGGNKPQMSEDECVTSTEFTLKHANGVFSEAANLAGSTNSTELPLVSINADTVAGADSPNPPEMFLIDEELAADIELLSTSVYTDPSGEFYIKFPPTKPPPELPAKEEVSPPPPVEPAAIVTPPESVNQQPANPTRSSPPADEPMEVKTSVADDASSSASSDSENDDDEDDDDDSSDAESEQQLPESESAALKASPPTPPPSPPKRRRRTKRIVIPVLKKKYRKCVGRARVKRSIVDRIADEQWENVNGNFDKDGVWHDFGDMTSAFVLTGGKNAENKTEENVLHILPYVNYTW